MRILVVEDEQRTAALLSRSLGEQGYEVDVATTGRDALSRELECEYAAVVLGSTLPDLSGTEVCRRLREGNRWVPVLMIGIPGSAAARSSAFDSGADDYLSDPFSLDMFCRRVQGLTCRGNDAEIRQLQVADLRLDPTNLRAWRGHVELDLSTKEFALLRLLLSRPGEVLTRKQILEHVWDYTYNGGSNIVDQYILYLRRKIDEPFGVKQLETVRGTGYRLREYV